MFCQPSLFIINPTNSKFPQNFKLKQMAKVLLFLQENDIHDYEQLEQLAKEATAQMDHLLSDIKQKEARMQEIRELRMHIINYGKTRDIYTAYRKAGYSRNFFEAHREEITLHKAAMEKEPTKQVAIDLEESLLVDLQKIPDQHHVALNKLIPTLIQAQLMNMNLVDGLLSSNDSGIE